MRMHTFTFAAIGAGSRGMTYGDFLLQEPHRGRMVAVAEPQADRRQAFCSAHGIAPDRSYATWEELLDQPRFCDAVIITTPDRRHMAPAMRALAAGYDILLEKPISPDPGDCLLLARRAEELGRTVTVCHVMRYAPLFQTLKRLLDEGRIGRLISIQWTENIAFWHFAHSFVRGNWRKAAESSPIILAKCCHDMDMLQWLVGRLCRRVHSFGTLTYFRPENAPANAARRCTDGCPHEPACVYSALKQYLGPDTGWPTNVISLDTSLAARTEALRTGPYGRCVYYADNDVPDHQVVNLEFEDGVTVAFSMVAFTVDNTRSFKLMGTRGEIRGYDRLGELEVRRFSGETEVIKVAQGRWGHGGGDVGVMRAFIAQLAGAPEDNLTSATASARSHLIAFAAEESRQTGRVVDLAEYEQRLLASP